MNFEDYATLKEAFYQTDIHPNKLRQMCARGEIPGAVQVCGRWVMPKEVIAHIERPPKDEYQLRTGGRLGGARTHMSVEEVAKICQVTAPTIAKMIRNGEVPGAERIGRNWVIPIGAVENLTTRPVGRPLKVK